MIDKFSTQKIVGISIALLLTLQVSLVADSTRVERYHNSKHQNTHTSNVRGPSRSDMYNTHRYSHRENQGSNRHYVRPSHRPLPHVAHRPHHVRPSHLHKNAYRFRHGGLNYRYRGGLFYRPYNHGYRVVSAPIGALIITLPIGYSHLRYQARDYYHYNDVYYQRDRVRNGYRVVVNPYNRTL